MVVNYKNVLCIEAGWLIESKILTPYQYNVNVQREKLKVVRRACRNTTALVDYESMPDAIKDEVKRALNNDPYKLIEENALTEFLKTNAKAYTFFDDYRLDGGRLIPFKTRKEYYNNAIILDAIHELITSKRAKRSAMGGSKAVSWEKISECVQSLDPIVYKNTLPVNYRSLRSKYNNYKKDGFTSLIHSNFLKGQGNAAKIDDETKTSILIELLGDPRNFDNARIAKTYNQLAKSAGWKSISVQTVANYRGKYDLETYAGRRGSQALRDKKLMQIKRKAPSMPLYYLTLDGWDVELLYQKFENGKTTYHHTPTLVIILDPCKKYPIGYAIGTHETPELIKAALRNAAQHSAELFGRMYRAHQIQSDNYAIKKMTPIYEAMADKVTPARVKNAKAKVIEPYFKYLNTNYCQLLPNWAGYGIKSKTDSQPNTEYLNQYKKHFPDFNGVCEQVALIVEHERQAKRADYLAQWEKLNDADKIELSFDNYLRTFGEKTAKKCMLWGDGLHPTIEGVRRSFDCFDLSFRQYAHVNWNIYYDPENTQKVLAIDDAETLRFVLEDKHYQPMALKDRKAGDGYELKRVNRYNDEVIKHITDTRAKSGDTVRDFFEENPKLDGTLAKLLLTDNRGQYKDNRNEKRAKQIGKPKKQIEPPKTPPSVPTSIYDKM